ncbi:hypothetical protein CLV99_2404 [Sphingobacterium yanglingense]|uniref:Uncharacterized protein n=1 Tax=Sphingobacterium yanglingense TaxID=1437280 RepID=A0A4R6WLX7_9SPHI|nr:hypothetical protein CLV99_2404 [Sphingobacterium yanglingense]
MSFFGIVSVLNLDVNQAKKKIIFFGIKRRLLQTYLKPLSGV